jgi:hypothetical protein
VRYRSIRPTDAQLAALRSFVESNGDAEAAAITISVSRLTLETHLRDMRAAFGVHSTLALVIHALRLGLIELGPPPKNT